MSIVQNNSYWQNRTPYNNKIFSKSSNTSTPTTTGTVLSIPSQTTQIVCKLWGAGAGGASSSTGGGGGYTTVTFVPNPACSYVISVGRAGLAAGTSTGGNILAGGTSGGVGGSGGDASILAELFSTTYTLLGVAGGGGAGSNSAPAGGAGGGGNNAGQSGQGTGGSGGSGGSFGGGSCSTSGSSLTGLGGAGANGSGGPAGAGGGGGYGGGGTLGGSAGSAGGGGGYAASSTSRTTVLSSSGSTGSGTTAGNNTDPDNTANYGQGGAASGNGNAGLAVVYFYANGAIIAVSTFQDATTASSSTLPYFSFDYHPQPILSSLSTGVTTTTASTLALGGPPVAGTNETIGTVYTLDVQSGNSTFGGGSILNANLSSSTNTFPKFFTRLTSPYQFITAATLTSGTNTDYQISGNGTPSIPSTASAVLVTFYGVITTGGGYVQANAQGSISGTISFNVLIGQSTSASTDVANTVVIPLNTSNGKITLGAVSSNVTGSNASVIGYFS